MTGIGTGFWARCSVSTERLGPIVFCELASTELRPENAARLASFEDVELTTVDGEAKTGVTVSEAEADDAEPPNAGPLPPTNGSTRVSTAVTTTVRSANRFITDSPEPHRTPTPRELS